MTEQVFVFDHNYMSGFKKLPGLSVEERDMHHLKYGCMTHGYFEDRPLAEENEYQKQVIPYILIRRGKRLLAYMRSKKAGDNRLHNKWSVGVGGHINPVDLGSEYGPNILLSATINRELLEELDWADEFDRTIEHTTEFGVLFDDGDPVGRVHIGYIAIVDVPENSKWPVPAEDTIADFKWVTPEEASRLPNLEGWSKIVVEAMLCAQTNVLKLL